MGDELIFYWSFGCHNVVFTSFIICGLDTDIMYEFGKVNMLDRVGLCGLLSLKSDHALSIPVHMLPMFYDFLNCGPQLIIYNW